VPSYSDILFVVWPSGKGARGIIDEDVVVDSAESGGVAGVGASIASTGPLDGTIRPDRGRFGAPGHM
jgi:hypothetical protein